MLSFEFMPPTIFYDIQILLNTTPRSISITSYLTVGFLTKSAICLWDRFSWQGYKSEFGIWLIVSPLDILGIATARAGTVGWGHFFGLARHWDYASVHKAMFRFYYALWVQCNYCMLIIAKVVDHANICVKRHGMMNTFEQWCMYPSLAYYLINDLIIGTKIILSVRGLN